MLPVPTLALMVIILAGHKILQGQTDPVLLPEPLPLHPKAHNGLLEVEGDGGDVERLGGMVGHLHIGGHAGVVHPPTLPRHTVQLKQGGK